MVAFVLGPINSPSGHLAIQEPADDFANAFVTPRVCRLPVGSPAHDFPHNCQHLFQVHLDCLILYRMYFLNPSLLHLLLLNHPDLFQGVFRLLPPLLHFSLHVLRTDLTAALSSDELFLVFLHSFDVMNWAMLFFPVDLVFFGFLSKMSSSSSESDDEIPRTAAALSSRLKVSFTRVWLRSLMRVIVPLPPPLPPPPLAWVS
jgi:hypothetical protein